MGPDERAVPAPARVTSAVRGSGDDWLHQDRSQGNHRQETVSGIGRPLPLGTFPDIRT
jgi:hypothetical protein